jgi:hypothetical protein
MGAERRPAHQKCRNCARVCSFLRTAALHRFINVKRSRHGPPDCRVGEKDHSADGAHKPAPTILPYFLRPRSAVRPESHRTYVSYSRAARPDKHFTAPRNPAPQLTLHCRWFGSGAPGKGYLYTIINQHIITHRLPRHPSSGGIKHDGCCYGRELIRFLGSFQRKDAYDATT